LYQIRVLDDLRIPLLCTETHPSEPLASGSFQSSKRFRHTVRSHKEMCV